MAPLIAMQAIQTAIILQQLKEVNRKLDSIKNTLDDAIARSEATHAGELLAASDVVDEIYGQYELMGSFSRDMLIRLALAERDLRALAQRFRFLVDTHAIAEIDDIAGVQRANYDAHSAMLSSFLELRISYLRVCVDMQENSKSGVLSVDRLKSKLASGIQFWQEMLQRSDSLRAVIRDREGKLNDMNWVERMLPEFIGGRGAAADRGLKALKDAYVSTLESELAIVKGFDSLIRSAKETLAELENPTPSGAASPTLIYWRDELGEHSFSSEKIGLGSLLPIS